MNIPQAFRASSALMYLDYRQGEWSEVLPLISAINLKHGSTLIEVVSGQKKGERVGYVLATQPRYLGHIEAHLDQLSEDGHFATSEFRSNFIAPLIEQMQLLA